MSKNVLIPIADGIEELEMMALVDILRRAGAQVTLASVGALQIVSARGLKITADVLIQACVDKEYELIVLPGGMPGAEHLRDCDILIEKLKEQKASKRLFGAICASPVVVLNHHGLLEGLNATAYPSMASQLADQSATSFDVVVDQNCITSRGPGTALRFALKLVELLFDQERATQIARAMLIT